MDRIGAAWFRRTIRLFTAGVSVTIALAAAAPAAAQATFDILLRGGTVIDGSGATRVTADVGITNGRIAAVGDLGAARATTVLDVTGLYVAPGFINPPSPSRRCHLTAWSTCW